ncbi:MAG: hypothetical protein MZV70_43975 [Desulfobacterales bacterium]|nr:hypothetical protein [Desulfobacterales bacterium]
MSPSSDRSRQMRSASHIRGFEQVERPSTGALACAAVARRAGSVLGNRNQKSRHSSRSSECHARLEMRVELLYGRGKLAVDLPENLRVTTIRKKPMPVAPDPVAAAARVLPERRAGAAAEGAGPAAQQRRAS